MSTLHTKIKSGPAKIPNNTQQLNAVSATRGDTILLHEALDGSSRTRRETLEMFTRGAHALSARAPASALKPTTKLLEGVQSYLASRPPQLIKQWLPEFRRRITETEVALKGEAPDLKALRVSALPGAERGAQLSILGARLFNVVSAFQEWTLDPSASQTGKLKATVAHALKLWSESTAPVSALSPHWNCKTFLERALCYLDGKSNGSSHATIREPIKYLLDLIKSEHQWLRWSIPNNLSFHRVPKDFNKISFRFDTDTKEAVRKQHHLSERITLSSEDPQKTLIELTELRKCWSEALHLLMPAGASPLIAHFRDTVPPEEVLRELHLIQHLWRTKNVKQDKAPVDSAQWIRARIEESRASLFTIMNYHNVHSFYLALYDESRFPPGPTKIISKVVGEDALHAARVKKEGHAEMVFSDLVAIDPRNRFDYRSRGFSPMSVLHNVAHEFGELDAQASRDVFWYAICRSHPVQNPSITKILADGWRRTGFTYDNAFKERYDILTR